jgi:N-acetylmuramoyl-L-alanine amidase
LNSSSKRAALLSALLATAAAVALLGHAQSTPAPAPPTAPLTDRNLIVLDPAHGGPDNGAILPGLGPEKDVTLTLANRLRAALTSAGFAVVSTRENDPPVALSADQRADIVNRAHPLACILLHATATGSGVHIYTSTLPAPNPQAANPEDTSPPFTPIPWDEAQAGFIPQSLALASSLTAAFADANLPAFSGRVPLRPLDNLTCPAVAIELAPLPVAGEDPTSVGDPAYQQRIAATLATALRASRDHPGPPFLAAPGTPR